MGEAKDDIHVCIMRLRAIMNNKYGFNMVIERTQAINCIALSLNHKSLRAKTLVLEFLAAICLVKGGHQIILAAFDNFKDVCGEKKRFETLMDYFINYEVFNIDFMANEQIQEMENELMARLVELETHLECLDAVTRERNELLELHKQTDEELNTLRRVVSQKDEESRQRQSILESKIEELESNSLPRGTVIGGTAIDGQIQSHATTTPSTNDEGSAWSSTHAWHDASPIRWHDNQEKVPNQIQITNP
nr:formin-like protein [Parasteatoda tepidariorum]